MRLSFRIILLVLLLASITTAQVWWTASSSPERMTDLALRQFDNDPRAAQSLRTWSITSNQLVSGLAVLEAVAVVGLLWPEITRGWRGLRGLRSTPLTTKENSP